MIVERVPQSVRERRVPARAEVQRAPGDGRRAVAREHLVEVRVRRQGGRVDAVPAAVAPHVHLAVLVQGRRDVREVARGDLDGPVRNSRQLVPSFGSFLLITFRALDRLSRE